MSSAGLFPDHNHGSRKTAKTLTVATLDFSAKKSIAFDVSFNGSPPHCKELLSSKNSPLRGVANGMRDLVGAEAAIKSCGPLSPKPAGMTRQGVLTGMSP